jgi:hypothetical protein
MSLERALVIFILGCPDRSGRCPRSGMREPLIDWVTGLVCGAAAAVFVWAWRQRHAC